MPATMQETIRDYLRGGFKTFKLYAADDGGFGIRELVGGFDTLAEAEEAARAIERECDRLVSEGWTLSTDESVNPYFWIYDEDALVMSAPTV